MIQLPSDYDSAQSFNGGSSASLTVGPHMCRIRAARLEKARTGRDMLVIAFDIFEPGEFTDYYKNMFDRMRRKNPDAKWPGIFRTTITNAEGKTNGFFKGLIESVEASNNGYNFRQSGANEATLQGKLVGFNFGEEEYMVQTTGEVKTAVKPFYAVSAAEISSGLIVPPAKKLLNNNSAPAAYSAPAQPHQTTFTEVSNDELPF